MLVIVPAPEAAGFGACWPAQPSPGVPGQWELALKNDCSGCPVTSMHAPMKAVLRKLDSLGLLVFVRDNTALCC